MDSWQNEANELQEKVAKLTQEGKLWKFEKALLVSALHAAKMEFNHKQTKVNGLREKLRRTKSFTTSMCETPHCHRIVEKEHHHCAVCKTETNSIIKNSDEQHNDHIIVSLREELRKQIQTQHEIEEKLANTELESRERLKMLETAERDRAVIAQQLTQEQTRARMEKDDMEYQTSLLHGSLLESSARLEHVTSQLRESCHQKVSAEKTLESSLVTTREASMDELLENSARALEFKSMKLLQRLMATRLRWATR